MTAGPGGGHPVGDRPVGGDGVRRPVRCLLLGATGFIGRQVRRRLADRPGVELVAAARGPGADLRVDLTRIGVPMLAALVGRAEPEVVVNCAGTTTGSVADLVAGNVVAVSTLVEALARADSGIRLVHLGSAAEYRPVDPGGVDLGGADLSCADLGRIHRGWVEHPGIDETTPTEPCSPYGLTKLAGTALVTQASAHGMAAVTLRVFNPIGPYAPRTSLPGRLVEQLAGRLVAGGAGEPVVLGCLDGFRDFVDVRDVADAIVAAALAERAMPPVLNIGSGRATALRDLVDAVVAATVAGRAPGGALGGAPVVVERADGSPRSAAVLWQRASISAAATWLGWQPRVDLRTSIRDMIGAA